MVEVSIEREFDVSAEKLWAILADFADISWIPGIEKVEIEGEGVGMIRHVTAPGLPQLHERMDAIDRRESRDRPPNDPGRTKSAEDPPRWRPSVIRVGTGSWSG
jgi:hypothetical protein